MLGRGHSRQWCCWWRMSRSSWSKEWKTVWEEWRKWTLWRESKLPDPFDGYWELLWSHRTNSQSFYKSNSSAKQWIATILQKSSPWALTIWIYRKSRLDIGRANLCISFLAQLWRELICWTFWRITPQAFLRWKEIPRRLEAARSKATLLWKMSWIGRNWVLASQSIWSFAFLCFREGAGRNKFRFWWESKLLHEPHELTSKAKSSFWNCQLAQARVDSNGKRSWLYRWVARFFLGLRAPTCQVNRLRLLRLSESRISSCRL